MASKEPRCGTCEWFCPSGEEHVPSECTRPIPFWAHGDNRVCGENGGQCPMWKESSDGE